VKNVWAYIILWQIYSEQYILPILSESANLYRRYDKKTFGLLFIGTWYWNFQEKRFSSLTR